MTDCYALCYWIPPSNPADICDPLIGMPLNEEECNNFDDNCNQLIDEDLYASCYTGSEGTLMVGICVPGEVTCLEGTWGNYDDDERNRCSFHRRLVRLDGRRNGCCNDCFKPICTKF